MEHPDWEPLWLTVFDADGQPHSEEVTGPPGTIRVGIGSHTCGSSVWRIWTKKQRNQSEVYAHPRNLGGVQKFSLHSSGDWHHGWQTRDIAEEFTGSPERHLDRWNRRDLPMSHGWTKVLTIWVPHGGLSDMPDEPPDDRVVWLPGAAPGRMAGIHVAIVAPDGGMPNMDAMPVGAFRLGSGEAVVVLYSTAPIPDGLFVSLAADMTKVGLTAEHIEAIRAASAPRVGVFGRDEHGRRVVYEMQVEVANRS
ncbi:MAG: hypothetical protein M3O78_04510 [Chloroflexota bacterium]|nr:hypothetical protein [Chloroflexota bacterium]